MSYVKIVDAEDSEPIEIPTEDDGTLTVAAVAAQYPGATGLKYRQDGHVRAVKLADGKLYPPEGGWSDHVYSCTFPKDTSKRKADDALETSDSKSSKVDSSNWTHTDLVVLGLPWSTSDKELHDYFAKFGDLRLAQVKIDPMTKKSKGYGFIRYADREDQVRVMLQRHQIGGRWCDVRIPVTKDSVGKKSPYKVFIGQCTEDLTEDVLRDYFSQFGEISDLYVPKPFRAFAFVTFIESHAAKNVCALDHKIKDTKVYVTEAVPKGETEKFERNRGRVSGRSRRDDFGGGQYDDSFYDRRRPWTGGREDNGWRGERWNDEPSYKDNSWRSKAAGGWSRPPAGGNRWRDNAGPPAADANIDPDVVAAVVNKAVMGVIGNLKQPSSASDLPPTNGVGYSKEDWWSRR